MSHVRAYYNEFDPKAAAWLRELIREGHIAPGDVDTRSICDVKPDDLRGYCQIHLFAGIGGWSKAFRLACVPDDEPKWSGSCPCPPFSAAGKKKRCPSCNGTHPIPCPSRTGYFICLECEHAWFADGRHLWPEMWRLIRDCRPAEVHGEQVAGPDGLIWLAGVRASLEILGYGVGASDLCSAGVGSPNIRQRLYWMADSCSERRAGEHSLLRQGAEPRRLAGHLPEAAGGGAVDGLADPNGGERNRVANGERREFDRAQAGREQGDGEPERCGAVDGLAQPQGQRRPGVVAERAAGLGERTWAGSRSANGRLANPNGRIEGHGGLQPGGKYGQQQEDGGVSGVEHAEGDGRQQRRSASGERGVVGGCGSGGMGDSDFAGSQGRGLRSGGISRQRTPWETGTILLPCADGKTRRIKPEIFPLVDGLPGRVDALRGAGNAINPYVAAEWVQAAQEAIALRRVGLHLAPLDGSDCI